MLTQISRLINRHKDHKQSTTEHITTISPLTTPTRAIYRERQTAEDVELAQRIYQMRSANDAEASTFDR